MSMTRYSFGDVILVLFPFTDQSASKKRPAVVISAAVYNESRPDIIVMAITSQLRDVTGPHELRVTHWQEAGLLKPSAIKPVIATL
jgi:mRNA interferase MazF